MTKVIVKGNDIEKALKILKKKTATMLKTLKEHRYYKKPSQIKRERNNASKRKRKIKK